MSETQRNPWRGRIMLLTLVHVVGTIGYTSVMTMAPVIRRSGSERDPGGLIHVGSISR